ncbi:putative carbohydrate esterase [Sesamum alatum]|uniref:Carbohydrate esterase n=1 Tax=Sesamum alatum TaxID=300844 RepID=A0AAE1YDZ7_9LAMI|nr:putative carbohydrate esterase [Sesamum alatum]
MAGRGGIMRGIWDRYVPPECESSPKVLRLNAKHKWEEARPPLHHDIDYLKTCGDRAWAVVRKFTSKEELKHWGHRPGPLRHWRNTNKRVEAWGRTLQSALVAGSCIAAGDAKLYKTRLEKFFIDIRSDLKLPELPVIQVALASAEGPYIDKVRKAQLEINLPNVKCIDAKGMKIGHDGLHLSTEGEVRVGQMMADAFAQFVA